jgi:DNA polymerase
MSYPLNSFCFMDLETRSKIDLRKEGGRRYAASPTTGILTAVFLLGSRLVVWAPVVPPGTLPRDPSIFWPADIAKITGFDLTPEIYEGGELPAPVRGDFARAPWVAHNAMGFDRLVWARLVGSPQAGWVDTLPLCRMLSLPAGLDAVGANLYGAGKDAGRATMLKLCKPMTRGPLRGKFIPAGAANLPDVIRYNIADVLLLAALFRDHIAPGLTLQAADLATLQADHAINDRGVLLDTELAETVITVELSMRDKIAGDLVARLEAAIDSAGDVRAMLRSPVRFRAYLSEHHGVTLPDSQRGTVMAYLDAEQPDDLLRDVLLARIGETRITSAKLRRGLDIVESDGVIRSTLAFYGAHTGRWAGRGLQFQNLPRPVRGVRLDDSIAALLGDYLTPADHIAAFLATVPPGLAPADVLSALIRACVIARPGYEFAIIDYANIEARALCWLAGDAAGLDVFRSGGDPYKHFAARVFGVPVSDITKTQRQAGKVGVLGCGYGMSIARLGDYARALGVDLDGAGTTAADIVEGWRDANPRIAGDRTGKFYNGVACRRGGIWKAAGQAFNDAIAGERSTVARCEFAKWGEHVTITLPSGRALIYRHARMEPREKFGEITPGPVYTQFRGRNPVTVDTYGAKLIENICQAVSRDLLADALVRLEAGDHPPALHVHDEVLVEIPQGRWVAFAAVLRALTTPPRWAAGLPLEAEGFTSRRYRKSPPPGVTETRARDGGLL